MPNSTEVIAFLEQEKIAVHARYVNAATIVIISLGGGSSLALLEAIQHSWKESQDISGYISGVAFIVIGIYIYLTYQEENARKLAEIEEALKFVRQFIPTEDESPTDNQDTSSHDAVPKDRENNAIL